MLLGKTFDFEMSLKDELGPSTVVDLTEPNNDPALPINIIDWGADPNREQGTRENDLVTLTKEDDTFHGRGGNDVIHGGDGFDRSYGGEGDDFIFGGAGGGRLNGGGGNDVIRGGDNTASGGSYLMETLLGGEGEDVLAGGLGNDVMYGDQPIWGASVPSSADVFLFDVKNWGRDSIMDFDDGLDKIQFGSASGVTNFNELEVEQFTSKFGEIYTVISFQATNGDPTHVNEIVLRGIEEDQIGLDDFIF